MWRSRWRPREAFLQDYVFLINPYHSLTPPGHRVPGPLHPQTWFDGLPITRDSAIYLGVRTLTFAVIHPNALWPTSCGPLGLLPQEKGIGRKRTILRSCESQPPRQVHVCSKTRNRATTVSQKIYPFFGAPRPTPRAIGKKLLQRNSPRVYCKSFTFNLLCDYRTLSLYGSRMTPTLRNLTRNFFGADFCARAPVAHAG